MTANATRETLQQIRALLDEDHHEGAWPGPEWEANVVEAEDGSIISTSPPTPRCSHRQNAPWPCPIRERYIAVLDAVDGGGESSWVG